MHEEWDIRSLPREENLEKAWKRKRFGVREIVFERWTGADRSKEWEPDRKERIYRSSIKLDRCRYWEVSRQLSRRWSSTDTGIEEVLRNKFGVKWESFGRETEKYRERDRRKNDFQIAQRPYKEQLVNLNRCRYREVSRDLSRRCREKCSSTVEVSRRYRGTTHQNQEQKLDRSTKGQEAIEETGTFSIDPPGIEEVSRLR